MSELARRPRVPRSHRDCDSDRELQGQSQWPGPTVNVALTVPVTTTVDLTVAATVARDFHSGRDSDLRCIFVADIRTEKMSTTF